ncbi:desmoplakin-B [Anableps anableps]
MSHYGSQQVLTSSRRTGSKGDLAGGMTYHYARSDVAQGSGNGYDPFVEGHRGTFSRVTMSKGSGMMSSAKGSPIMGGMSVPMSVSQRATQLQNLCKEYLQKSEYAIQANSGDTEYYMGMARDAIEKLKSFAMEMSQMGQNTENVIRSVEHYQDQLRGVHMAKSGTSMRRKSTRKSSGGWEAPGKSFDDAMGWIAQQKRLIETASWGDDPSSLEQQLIQHQRFHASLQGSPEVARANDDLKKCKDKANQHALDQAWDDLLKISNLRTEQLREMIQILKDLSAEIMWVNEKEEEELVFDWGDKRVEQYIPKKQESYSKLMSALEMKEKELHKLKAKVKTLLINNHPGSDKIEAYMDTLQTQWSWLLQITKCIDIHLKENGAYSQFFREANDTFKGLQKEHETIRKTFKCDKNTSLEDLKELLKGLEMERENIMDYKRQVKHLTAKSDSIVRLKPRNPEERNSSGVIVKALTDFKQDQKVIRKDNEAILKDNSQRSKWQVTGPGGLDMLIPSVCLIVPPPNPLSISLANKNEQYFDSIMSIWNQLYINVKSLIAWHYCLMEINYVNSLTIAMLSEMRPEEYRQIMKKLETYYEEFKISSHGSEMFVDDDKRMIENQVTGAQTHYDKLVVELPTYAGHQEQIEVQQIPEQQVQPQLIIIQQQPQQHHLLLLQQQEQQQQQRVLLLQQQQEKQQQLLLQQHQQEKQLLLQQQQEKQQQLLLQQQAAAEEEARKLEEERRQAELKKQAKKEVTEKEHVIKKDVMKVTKTELRRKVSSSSSSSAFSSSSHLLSELHSLRLRMDAAEDSLSQYVHICFGDDGAQDCGLKIIKLESVQDNVSSMRDEYTRLREQIFKEIEITNDLDKAQFLRNEIVVISQRLNNLESSSSAYVLRLRALRDMLESVARAEDIVKVHEARLTEKETTSLSPAEVSEYMETLKIMKAELMQKQDVLTSMESELSKAKHWNSQMGSSFHRCDLMLSKFSEQVVLLSDRWRRIQTQIDTRLQDLQLYLPQLQHYKEAKTSFTDWIEATRKKQDALQNTKIETVQAVKDHIINQKTLNTDIKVKRGTLDSVLKDNQTCVNTIKDYETDLASYTSGLETLLNVPIKRTMLQSPSMELNKEAIHLQTRYMELLTLSGDYYKFLGQLEKNMEELKMRNTQIDMLEDQLRSLKEEMEERNAKNKSLEEAVAQFKLQLSQSQEQLLSLEEVKQTTALQCSATKNSLDSTQSKLAELNSEVERLKYLLGEEKRNTKLAEERYTRQQQEYESLLTKRQKELETVSWSKMEVEKSLSNKEHEIEQLRRQLDNESASLMDLQKEMSKVRSHFSTEINSLKSSYESQIQISRTDIQRLSAQRDEDTAELQMQYERMEGERRNLEDELRRLRTFISQTEEQKKRVEEEAYNQRAMLIEDGHRRREMESQMELLMKQRDEERNQYREELAEVLKTLQEKNDQLVYVTHSLEEETRRRKTTEEGQVVLEQSLAQLQVKVNSSSVAATQLRECEEELLQTRLQLERENKERCRVEQNMSRLQGRIKDLQAVRDSLESQVENLRKAHQEEVGQRRKVEAELEKTIVTMNEYTSTITILHQSQEQASTSEKRGEEERIRLKGELEKTLRENQICSDQNTQLSAELKTIKQHLLQEQSRVKEANLRNEGLYKTIEEKSKALNENSAELERLKEVIETQTKEQLRMEEELRAVQQDKEELLKSKKGIDDELTSQITALELQLQASECSNAEHHNLVSELSSEREKLKLEAEKIQKQVTETKTTIQSLQAKYGETVSERDSLLLKLQRLELDKEQMQRLEEELSRIKLSQESEFRTKQRLQEENERVKRDLSYWKDQCDGKQSLIRQYDTDKDIHEREKKSLKSEIERLMKELRELEEKYKSRLLLLQKELQDMTVKQTRETELKRTREPPTPDASSVVFDGVRKPVTAKQLLDSGVLDKPTYNQLVKGQKTVPEVSAEKKVPLKGTGPIAGVIIESPKGPGSSNKPLCKLTFTEAKKENLLPPDSIDLLLDAQAATGHIIDPRTNQKLTVEEAYNQGVVDDEDRERLLAAEAAAVGYSGPGTNKPMSVFQAMKKGLTDKNTTLRLLQAQESVGGILDPILSVFLPRDIATERDLIDDNMCYALNQRPELYLDPETEKGVTYMAMKRRCKIEPHTGLLLLPIPEKVDPSKLVFEGVRKPVTAKHLLDCGVLDKPTFKDLENGKKTVPEVSEDKTVNLKGTGPIAGVIVSGRHKMSLTEAKKQMLLPDECADLLLEAQAATGHIIDPKANKKLTVEEACAKGIVDINDLDRLLASEAAAIGYKDPNIPKPISVFQAMKKGLIDDKNGMRLLQAQESVGGILDPNLSVFLPKDTAVKRNLIDKNLCQALNQRPEYYIDPETEQNISYQALKESCKIEPHTGLLLLPIIEKLDPSKLIFDGVRKPVTAKQLFDCGVLDKPTLNKLMKGEKTVPQVSEDKKISLKGTGSIAGVTVGSLGKMTLSEAKKKNLMPPESADLLLEAQAATGHIIDPMTNQKLTVEEACARGVVERSERDKLLEAEAAAVGYKDRHTGKSLSVFEAIKKGLIDKKTGVRLLQAQNSAGGILDPNLSVFLPQDTAIKRNLLDEDLSRALNQNPECYLDPDTERDASYGTLKKKCKTEPHTGLMLLPLVDRKDPSKLMFDGVRKPVSAQQLLDCGVLDKPTFNKLIKGEKTVPEVSVDKNIILKGTGSIAGVTVGSLGKMTLSEAKKKNLMPPESADLLLEAQAATGHIIDPMTNQKLTVEEACARGVVERSERDILLEAEAAAVGYKDRHTGQSLSVFEAIKKGLIDRKTGVCLLQAQESAGGILDPNLSVFLPKDTAIKRNLLDEDLSRALNQNPECYLDPDTERDASYGALKKKCKTEPHTGLMLLPLTERKDPSKLMFDGVRKPVSAQQLLDCGVLDKPTFNKLIKGEKTIAEVSVDKKIFLKGTGSIASVTVGSLGKMTLSEAKKKNLMPPESADLLLEAQAATGHIIDPITNQKLTVEEACAMGVVERSEQDKLLEAEAAAVGYKDRHTGKSLSVFEAIKKGLIDKKTGVRLLQAQNSAGGILDPNLSVFLPKDTAIKRNLLDEDLSRALNQNPECYLDPETERDASYGALKKKCKTEPHTGLMLLPLTERKDPSKLMFDGIRKPVSAQQLLDCGVLDKPTFNKLIKGEKTVAEVSVDKKVFLKGTGSIAGVTVGSLGKMTLSEAKKKNLMPPESADLLLEAQAATGHIIDPMTNQKLTVEEACARGVVERSERDKLLEAEAAAVGYKDRHTGKSLSVFEALKKGLIDKKTGVCLLQAQESAGGILDPNLSVFLPKDTAIKRNLLDEDLSRALNQNPECYLDPETERDASYGALKKKCKTEPHTGLMLLPLTERKDPSKLMFDGIRKPVSAQQLLDCGVLDKPTFNKLIKGEKTVPEVSVDKKVFLKGTGSIAGVTVGSLGKMTLSEAKKKNLMPPESADLLLEAQAATGHIIDPMTNQKLTVEEACARGVVERSERDILLEAEAAAVGYKDRHTGQSLSVFEAIKKGLIDRKTGVCLLQAQESAGGILDPNLSVFLPKDTAIKRNLLDEDLSRALNQNPECYLDPETERDASYGALKKKCKTEPHTGLMLLPLTERKDPSKLMFDGIRKPVSAQQLLDCGVLDKPTFNKLIKGEKTVAEVSVDKKVFLKGTGSIAGVTVGSLGKMTLSEAKKKNLMPPESADLLLEAQAATGHIIDPMTNQKLTVEEACARGVVERSERDKLLEAEAAAVGYKDRHTGKSLSVFEALKKGLIDKKTGVCLLQAQESAGGILDPNLSVFLPKDTAIKRNLLDEDLSRALNQNPECYLDPETERDASYGALKKKCKTEPHTGLMLLPLTERKDPSKLMFDGIRKPVSAQQLLDCGVLDKPTFNKLIKGEKTVAEVSVDKKVFLKGTGSIAGVTVGSLGKMTLSEAKKKNLMPPESADLLLEAQAATGHIIDPMTNQKLTVEEACARGVVERSERDKLLEAEAAAVGYKDRHTGKSLSVFEALKKGLIDKKTGVCLLQAQESAGGILDPNLSVFLPKDTAIKRNLLDEDLSRALNQNPESYLDPETERDASYGALKKKCKTEPHTGLMLLPLTERKDPSKLMFDGIRKPVSAQQLLDCGVLDKPTFNKLIKGEKTVAEVSVDKKIFLKGTGSIASVTVGSLGKMTLSEAKKKNLMPPESADLLLEAQAATGHIIDPITNQKLTVEEACARGVVERSERDKLLEAEAAAVGYKDRHTGKSLSVFEAIKKGLIDKKTGVRLLQAQNSAGGILDPNLSVFLPKDTAIKRNLLDEDLSRALNQNPECYLDPETERDASYGALKKKCKTESHTGLMLLPLTEKKDPSKLMFDGVRKPVSAQQLLDCGVLDKTTFNKLIKGEKTIAEVSVDKKIFLKGTGSIAGVTVGSLGKMTLSEAKKKNLMPPESADLLLEAQAATGHIIDPMTNQKLTVEEACARGVVERSERDKLLEAEAAAVGYKDRHTGKSLSVFEAIKKGLIDKKTGVRLLQAQNSAGGILDSDLSVFLPQDTAIKRNLLDEDLSRALNQNPECYLDPDTERDASYGALKKKCKTEHHTGLMLLPLTERKEPSKLMFDGVRKPVSAQQLLDCGVLDKPTFNKLIKGEKTVAEVSVDKKIFLKGTGSIAGVTVGSLGKMTLSEAKKKNLMPPESADLLLEAQAATGHIIDPMSNQKLTVEEACAMGVVERSERDKLLEAEAAAVGYKDRHTGKSLSVFEAIKKGLIDKKTGVRLLQAQNSAGGILNPNLSVFLPKDTAIKHNLLDEDLSRALNQNPECYFDPDTERDASFGALKKKCKTEPHTGLMLLPLAERKDPSKLMFDGVRKPVSAQQLLDCGVLDKPTFNKLIKGEKTVAEVSVDKKIFLKGTGSIAGVTVGSLGKMTLSEAKKKNLMPPESADLLLEAQAATGHIIDPMTNQKLTVEEACARGVVERSERDKLLEAEAAAVGYKDRHTGQSLSVFEAIKKGLIDRKTGVRLLQAQNSAGGVFDPNFSVFFPKETALKRNLLDEDLVHALNQNPECYLDPDTERGSTYGALKKRCKIEPHTGLVLLPLAEKNDPSKLMFEGVRKPVSAQQLLECGVLDQSTFNKLIKGEKTVAEVSADKKVNLKGTGPIAGVCAGRQGNISFSDAKKLKIISDDSANLLLEAQAATGHIIDPKTEQKLTVEVACIKGVVDFKDQSRLLAAEGAAVGYKDPCSGTLISLFEAMKKGVIDEKTGLHLLQAQDSVGGILDPHLSIFLPKDTAVKHNLLDEKLIHALKQNPPYYLDPETEYNVSYGALKAKCNTNTHTGLHILPVSEKFDPSKILFDGVHKTVTAQQLLDCGVLDKQTFGQLMKGTKTVSDVSVDIKIFLKGTGSIAGVAAGPLGKMSFTEAKKQKIMSPDSAHMLLLAQAATGHIIDPRTNKKLTVKEACARGLVDKEDESMLFEAEAAAVGYRDPDTAKFLSAGQAMKKGIINKDTALQLLQAQESVGGILDPSLSVYLPKDIARKQDLIDEDLYQALNMSPKCYLDPDTKQPTTYVSLKTKCKSDPSTGLLLLPKPKQSETIRGLRNEVSLIDLVDANLLSKSDVDQLNAGKLTSHDIEDRLWSYLGGSTCIAGVYDEASDKVLSIYQAMKNGLLRCGTTLELLEAQAASGFMIDPVNNLFLTVAEAYDRRLFGPEFKDKLLAAEKAVTGYKMPVTGEIISLFQAIENGLVEKGHGIRLLEAQIASGGIIDPQHSHRIDVNVAYKRGYFNEEMNKILTDESDDTKDFFDPNTEENLTYLELKKRCISDKNTGLVLLPIIDKRKLESSQKNTVRKRRVIIVDPETDKEMTVREAYNKGYIDYNTYLELSEQECEWEEITITAPDGSTRFVIIDRSTGRQYDINDLIEKRVIDQSVVEQYRSHAISITQFADIISNQTKQKSSTSISSQSASSNIIPEPSGRSSVASSSSSMVSTSGTSASLTSSSVTSTSRTSVVSVPASVTSSSSSSSSSTIVSRPLSPTFTKTTTTKTTTIIERSSSSGIATENLSDSLKQLSSVSITLSPPLEAVGEVEPVGAIFDTETVEKVSITEALNRGLVDSITAQRLLEAQACTGGIVNPTDGKRVSIQEASHMGLVANDMVTKLKPAQKAYFGFEDIKTNRKLSAAQAMKEMWLPYEAGQRFLEFQVATGGLYDPEKGCRRSIDDALKMGWLDLRAAQKLQDIKHHTKNMTCPKSKLRISYKEALDNCLVEEGTGVKMLQASSVSSRGISSPYNVASAPGSKTGSRSGSQRGSRRSSLDLGSSLTHNFASFTSFSSTS